MDIFYRGINGEFNINDVSIELASDFDDILYEANDQFGESGSYDYDEDALNRYFEANGMPYEAKNGKFIAFGVNAVDDIDLATDFTACPNATKIVKFEGRYIGRNLCDDGDIVKITRVLEIIDIV
ncbi:hypothetical protein BC792_12737 [Sphingobacterium allocomposti]|uniref:Uncharacterized protein n=1 Tax=Sphingobacterium allocomposti TaxID=415956 RepID=A0A5S5D2Q7_9SPHI|nr:hypothetical protein [Sphingobacterium composti Yoo et al. 2007 non Ten et al. 2007]TYP89436.1 hypothetical protein BC792_12737 [Sphingobacterium composti Yoo et al. 2007 non Ten et al. 2007]